MGERSKEGPEWEVVRFYRLGEDALGREDLMALLTPAGNASGYCGGWAVWKKVDRDRFGDHIVGSRVRVVV